METARLLSAVAPLVDYDDEGRSHGYVYSACHDRPWVKPLAKVGPRLIADLAAELGVTFETVSFQAYRDKSAWCDWHVDACEDQAVLSLGGARRVEFEETATGAISGFVMRDGDLMHEPPGHQQTFRHRVPPATRRADARVALVFRTGSAWG